MAALAENRPAERALADKRRRQIVERLRAAPAGLDTSALADALDLHPSTVRWHLGILGDAGLVEPTPKRRPGRGRPTLVYRLTPEGAAAGKDEYRLLATMLTGLVAERTDGRARAYETGRRWGRYLVERPLPNESRSEADAVGAVVELLDAQGFAASAEDGCVRMRRCPFAALAESNAEIVCSIHRGLIDGAFEELGARASVEALDVRVEPTLCIAHLHVPGAG